MSFAELEKELLSLTEQERARLVVSLLETLPPPETEVSDEEVLRRDAELSSGEVQEISHEEFVRQAARDRLR